jgi:threonyl-tRNA synthetase
MIRHLIETYWKDVHLRHGYELIYSPHIAKVYAATEQEHLSQLSTIRWC